MAQGENFRVLHVPSYNQFSAAREEKDAGLVSAASSPQVTPMDRQTFRTTLAQLALDDSPVEAEARAKMLTLLDETPRCFFRDGFPGHFTGSALVVSHDGAQALLNHHRFLDKWLQFGGHCDGEEDVLSVARREAEEESGIHGLIVASEKPFDLDVHAIPENPKKGEPPHFHYDVRYVLIAPEGAQFQISEESKDLRWFTPQEARALEVDESMRRMIGKWEQLLERRHQDRPA
jgi:8-oxo-dGTP pyrophosphatase MutT (NUDIX family)